MIRFHHLLLSFLVFLLLVMSVYFLLDLPHVFNISRDIDVNSGDVRVKIEVCYFRIKDEIQKTPFSEEVRRLGINVSHVRKWVPTHTKLLSNKRIYYIYGGTPAKCKLLVKMFNDGNVSEEDRRAILQKFLNILQSGDRHLETKIEAELQVLAEKVYKVTKQ
ncbi:hypothetical protein ACFL5Z_20560 [Planctomycetota bacterium]